MCVWAADDDSEGCVQEMKEYDLSAVVDWFNGACVVSFRNM